MSILSNRAIYYFQLLVVGFTAVVAACSQTPSAAANAATIGLQSYYKCCCVRGDR